MPQSELRDLRALGAKKRARGLMERPRAFHVIAEFFDSGDFSNDESLFLAIAAFTNLVANDDEKRAHAAVVETKALRKMLDAITCDERFSKPRTIVAVALSNYTRQGEEQVEHALECGAASWLLDSSRLTSTPTPFAETLCRLVERSEEAARLVLANVPSEPMPDDFCKAYQAAALKSSLSSLSVKELIVLCSVERSMPTSEQQSTTQYIMPTNDAAIAVRRRVMKARGDDSIRASVDVHHARLMALWSTPAPEEMGFFVDSFADLSETVSSLTSRIATLRADLGLKFTSSPNVVALCEHRLFCLGVTANLSAAGPAFFDSIEYDTLSLFLHTISTAMILSSYEWDLEGTRYALNVIRNAGRHAVAKSMLPTKELSKAFTTMLEKPSMDPNVVLLIAITSRFVDDISPDSVAFAAAFESPKTHPTAKVEISRALAAQSLNATPMPFESLDVVSYLLQSNHDVLHEEALRAFEHGLSEDMLALVDFKQYKLKDDTPLTARLAQLESDSARRVLAKIEAA